MKAMILAAGVGSRLDPLTRTIPKPMVPIANRPVIEHIVEKLAKHGFTDIMINLHYLGDVIQSYLGDGSQLGVNLSYAQEDQLWGDAGSVKNSQDFFKGETFLVVGGDDISNIDLSKVLEFHKNNNSVASMALTLVDDPSQFGIVVTDEHGRITRFLEKPKIHETFSNSANTGVYIFEPEVFDVIPAGEFYGFGNNVFPKLLESGKPMYGYVTDAYWKDVGNLQVYRKTNFDALGKTVLLNIPGEQRSEGVWIGRNTQIDPSVEMAKPVLIGDNVKIGAGVKILENTVIGDNCVIEANATLKETILWQGAVVEEGTHLERCVLGVDSRVKSNAGIFDANIVNPERRQEK